MNETYIIEIKGRYFYGFGKTGRVKTAWSIAGGFLFVHLNQITEIKKKLDDKKISYQIKKVTTL